MIDLSSMSEQEISEIVDSLKTMGYIQKDSPKSKGYALNRAMNENGIKYLNADIRTGIFMIADEVFNNTYDMPTKSGKRRCRNRMMPEDEAVEKKYIDFLEEICSMINKYGGGERT